ncbi:hypothetical protein DL98DRAFT_189930, partial [Cadophora sp. DSE1049]
MFLQKSFTALVCVLSFAQGEAIQLPIVDLGYGLHRASMFDSELKVYNFSNIRYAAPPLAKLRFSPPQTPTSNYSSVNDGLDSRICPQATAGWL